MIAENLKENMKVAVYTRVSTEDQALEGFSLEAQLDTIKAYCKTYKLDIFNIYIEEGESGRTTKRPKYQQMMKDMKFWDAIIVLKMDRIHRNSKNFMEMMETLNNTDKDFISVTEKLDTTSAMGRFVMDIIQRVAQLESEQIGERVFIGMSQKAKDLAAGFIGNAPPYGFDTEKEIIKDSRGKTRTKSQLIPNKKEQEIVKEIYDLYNNGETVRAIGKKVKKASSTVTYILRNPIYLGYFKWNRYLKRAAITPIISTTLWNLVQTEKDRRTDNSKKFKPLIIDGTKDLIIISPEKAKNIVAITKPKHKIEV